MFRPQIAALCIMALATLAHGGQGQPSKQASPKAPTNSQSTPKVTPQTGGDSDDDVPDMEGLGSSTKKTYTNPAGPTGSIAWGIFSPATDDFTVEAPGTIQGSTFDIPAPNDTTE